MTHDGLAALDARLAGQESKRWDDFYANRARPVPFFPGLPDENLAEWLANGTIGAGGRALDLGCGNGRNAICLARHGFRVDGVDYSETALAWARERAREAGAEVDFRCASVFDAALEPGAYGFVYDSGCFHHIAPHRRQQYIALAARTLKPGGWFGMTCFRPEGGSGYTDDEVYERNSLGGGLGYTEQHLRDHWASACDVRLVRQMKEQPADSAFFGKDFLWVLLARKPAEGASA
ncbi:class I SAM-dependent methyltransferase [Ramlibacter sp. XY19]|uniref:class I SAM-dependent methyltransferase n=1 Tax=Ramlibacter paludis TaxID=2908000 RepID=UPI0023DC99F3|nr:class I SAM-dependent methyltransferase [Ramlibacter paludis]MCG2593975.1 class I SAM-dependent methyltransferase [Ramlibacter paludis]